MVYWERQNSGYCRKHAINAYYQCEKITVGDFERYCSEFDNFCKGINIECDVKNNDIVIGNQLNVISYIIYKISNIYTLLIPFNNYEKLINIYENNIIQYDDFIFMYNLDHIWGIKKIDNKWIKIDSLSGISEVNMVDMFRQKNVGFMIPRRRPMVDYEYNVENIIQNLARDSMRYKIYDDYTELLNIDRIVEENYRLGRYIEDYELSIGVCYLIKSLNGGYDKKYLEFLGYFNKNLLSLDKKIISKLIKNLLK